MPECLMSRYIVDIYTVVCYLFDNWGRGFDEIIVWLCVGVDIFTRVSDFNSSGKLILFAKKIKKFNVQLS